MISNPHLDDQQIAPLSFAQERLWFLQQLQPHNPAYNRILALKLKGPLDVAILTKALQEIRRRQEILQASFPLVEGKPLQVSTKEHDFDLEIKCVSTLPPVRQKSEAELLAMAEVQKPFDLSKGPLVRATLLRLSPEEHILIVVLHQIICDAFSTKLFLKEMIAFYESFSDHKPSLLPDLPVQYRDFSLHQRAGFQETWEGQLSFWKRQLHSLAPLALHTDRPRPPVQSYRGATQSILLPGALSESLNDLSRRQGVTLSMTMLAAFQALLHRYTQQDDIVVGCITDSRNIKNRDIIGCFENTLVLRTDLHGKPDFTRLLETVQEVCSEAFANKDIPFAELVKELGVEPDLSQSPLFQVMFNIDISTQDIIKTSNLIIEKYEFESGIVQYDLTMEINNINNALQCLISYNNDLFDHDTIIRMMGHYKTLLHAVVANPQEPIFKLALLTDEEHHEILIEWNDTKTDYPKDRCIHQLFEAQADRTPQAAAVSFGDRTLTYGQLDASANQMAHYLKRQGVGPDVPVGICMEPSLEMMVGVVGILKAGGCYVPLDTEFPKERMAFLLKDTQAKVLLTQECLRQGMPAGGPPIISVDGNNATISRESTDRVVNDTKPDNLACIFYTSGSTGIPKGVPVPHYAVNRLVRNTNYIDFQPSDRIAQAANTSFDGVTFEIWGALLNGGCLVGLAKDILLSSRDFAVFIQEHRINVLFLTPALFHQFAREVPDAFRSVRDLIMGGEILEPRWVKAVMEHGPPDRLLNGYGPTESTTFATCYLVRDLPEEKKAIPIGRPLSNSTVYILDRNLQPVPVGVPGELCIGGDGLARGYLNHPEQTAEKFIPNPFSDEPGSRLYRTGDLACYLSDGNVDFLGRIDHQIKIRGFRIEPGEIEVTLLSHADVEESLVMAGEVGPGDKRLIAYVVPSHAAKPTAEALRDFLKDRLPPYMLPAFYVFLDKFPLNPNGKVDRLALSGLDFKKCIIENVYVAPRDEIEKRLVEDWEEVLGFHPIGIHDDFFALGGHSLIGARLFTKIEKNLGKKLPLTLLYQRSTVAQLAEVFRQPELLASASFRPRVTINPSGTKPPFFWIQGKDGIPFMKRSLGENQPLYYLQSPFEIDNHIVFDRGIEGVAGDYLKQMRQIQGSGPYFLGGFSLGGMIAFEIAMQLKQQGSKVALLFLLDPTIPGESFLIGLPIARHVEQLKRLGPRGNLLYVINGMKNLLTKLTFEALWKIGRISKKTFPAQAWRSAIKDYPPKVFSDSAVIIRSKDVAQKSRFDWRSVTSDQSKIHLINASHSEILKRPHITTWVGYLKQYLQEAQAMASKDKP